PAYFKPFVMLKNVKRLLNDYLVAVIAATVKALSSITIYPSICLLRRLITLVSPLLALDNGTYNY
ncbi:MAG: hypothetical protein ACXW0Q_12310, partial [Methylovulum sp.]